MVEFFQMVGDFFNFIVNLLVGAVQSIYSLIGTLVGMVQISLNFVGFLPAALATMVIFVTLFAVIMLILEILPF